MDELTVNRILDHGASKQKHTKIHYRNTPGQEEKMGKWSSLGEHAKRVRKALSEDRNVNELEGWATEARKPAHAKLYWEGYRKAISKGKEEIQMEAGMNHCAETEIGKINSTEQRKSAKDIDAKVRHPEGAKAIYTDGSAKIQTDGSWGVGGAIVWKDAQGNTIKVMHQVWPGKYANGRTASST